MLTGRKTNTLWTEYILAYGNKFKLALHRSAKTSTWQSLLNSQQSYKHKQASTSFILFENLAEHNFKTTRSNQANAKAAGNWKCYDKNDHQVNFYVTNSEIITNCF